jgi:hypothetical protein
MSKMQIFGWIVLTIICIVVLWAIGKGCQATDKVTNVETAFINYEEFFNIYNTCYQIDADLGNLRTLPDSDKMFTQFSKAQLINTKQLQLNRWINEYNSKSSMWHRRMWKDGALPYTLTTNHFSNYK